MIDDQKKEADRIAGQKRMSASMKRALAEQGLSPARDLGADAPATGEPSLVAGMRKILHHDGKI